MTETAPYRNEALESVAYCCSQIITVKVRLKTAAPDEPRNYVICRPSILAIRFLPKIMAPRRPHLSIITMPRNEKKVYDMPLTAIRRSRQGDSSGAVSLQ